MLGATTAAMLALVLFIANLGWPGINGLSIPLLPTEHPSIHGAVIVAAPADASAPSSSHRPEQRSHDFLSVSTGARRMVGSLKPSVEDPPHLAPTRNQGVESPATPTGPGPSKPTPPGASGPAPEPNPAPVNPAPVRPLRRPPRPQLRNPERKRRIPKKSRLPRATAKGRSILTAWLKGIQIKKVIHTALAQQPSRRVTRLRFPRMEVATRRQFRAQRMAPNRCRRRHRAPTVVATTSRADSAAGNLGHRPG